MPAGFTAAGTPVGVQFVGRHRGERDLLGLAKGFESVTTCASIHPHWADLDGVRSRTGPNPRRLARVFTRAGPYATSDRERTHTEQMRTATDDFARPQGHVRQSPRERSCLLYTSPSPRDGLL